MHYTVYISYSMSDSSKAYDLSGQLSRQKITYNLDCIESGYNLSDYTKQNIEECKVYVALVGVRYAESKYALDTLHHAINHGKHIIVCPIEGIPLPEAMATYTTAQESNLLATLTRAVNGNDNENKDGGPRQAIYENVIQHIDDEENNVNEDNKYIDKEEYIDKKYIAAEEEEEEEEKSAVFSIQQPEITSPSVSTLGSWTVYNESHDTTSFASSKELQEGQQEAAPYIETRGKWEPDNAKTNRVPTIEEVVAAEKNVKKHLKNSDSISIEHAVIIATLIIFVPCIISIISNKYDTDTTKNVQPEKTRIELHYEKISDEDILEGQQLNAIGIQYMNGTNEMDKNPAKALKNFEKAAKLGNVNAMYNAGICYMMANRKKQNLEELNIGAMHLYEATEAGHDKSLDKLKEMADMNIAYAQALLGKCYQMGYSTFTDHSQAIKWYMKAVDNGSSLGMYHLAWYYLYGKGGISVDLKVAYELYLQAENLGLKKAQGKADMVKAMMEKAENSTSHTPTTPH